MNPYLSKYRFCETKVADPPSTNLGIVIVIPCYNEPDLISSLTALKNCERTRAGVEVIVVINSSEKSEEDVLTQNETTFRESLKWIKDHAEEKIKFHLINVVNLPHKHAGVGLARKIGMDEAVARFDKIGKADGVIVCFDADCVCDTNYLKEIENHFVNNRNCVGCSIYFEHPVEGNQYPQDIYDGITNYELFLRYYNQGLRYSRFPHAYHTIGSGMAVRSDIYQKQGGMNRRKAGEDFYFLHKIIPLGNFSEINTTRVIPSPRVSERVPFGTGKAIGKWVSNNSKVLLTYHPQIFIDLKNLFLKLHLLYESDVDQFILQMPDSIKNFLVKNNCFGRIAEIKQHVASQEMFIKRFFQWFDGFMVLKYVHFARDNYFDQISVIDAAEKLLQLMGVIIHDGNKDAKFLLRQYRNLDNKNTIIGFKID